MIVTEALKRGPFSMRDLGESSGLNYRTLRAWAAGLRVPMPENLRQLAAGFRTRAATLEEWAGKLERAAKETDAQG